MRVCVCEGVDGWGVCAFVGGCACVCGWPSPRDELEWLKRSTVCPITEGVCVCVCACVCVAIPAGRTRVCPVLEVCVHVCVCVCERERETERERERERASGLGVSPALSGTRGRSTSVRALVSVVGCKTCKHV